MGEDTENTVPATPCQEAQSPTLEVAKPACDYLAIKKAAIPPTQEEIEKATALIGADHLNPIRMQILANMGRMSTGIGENDAAKGALHLTTQQLLESLEHANRRLEELNSEAGEKTDRDRAQLLKASAAIAAQIYKGVELAQEAERARITAEKETKKTQSFTKGQVIVPLQVNVTTTPAAKDTTVEVAHES